MRELRRFWILGPALAVLALAVAWFMTRGAMEQLGFLQRTSGGEQGIVDQRPWQTAATLARLAVSAEEQSFAQEAERLADHEVDQAFATALRQASVQPRKMSAQALALEQRITELKQLVAQDKAAVDAQSAAQAKAHLTPTPGDDLDIAKAQLGLDSDELDDASADLTRVSGDKRAQIEQELQTREAAMKKVGDVGGETAVTSARRYGTLKGRVEAWSEERSRAALLAQAEQRTRQEARDLATQHDQLEKTAQTAAFPQKNAVAGAAQVKALQQLAAQRGIMSILDDRVQTDQQLAAVYQKWEAQVWVQHRIVAHLLLQSLAWIALIVLGGGIAARLTKMAIRRLSHDEKKTRTLDRIAVLGVEFVAAVLILLVIFGPPQQMPTILGLATAGLTVVFQDYILSFFGWFYLMGRNGVRVGDWVEINSIGGEVQEIGLFRTVLLETGNWTSQGHPTGRRVTFSNSFAIRGQYFNFSTHGQWMWDEIRVNLAAGVDAAKVIGPMQTAVQQEAAKDTESADMEWRGVTGALGLGQFRAAPTVDLRPAAAGVDLIVRFMTRANQRFEQRNRLYQTMLRVLSDAQQSEAQSSPPATIAPASA